MQRVLIALGRKSRLFLYTLNLLSVPAVAQQKQRLELVVTDATGAVVPQANVVIEAPGERLAASGTSNDAGEFDAGLAPGGVLLVKLSHAGFEGWSSGWSLATGRSR